ncbi:hypothetical protein [Singulisphaera sp. PoT]|uniref:hypothetical protein n=1 Tax=Singulisphaera sp. PoT TaxID=3411797 RepID=UPI003BF4D9A9
MDEVFFTYEQAVYGSFSFWDRGYAILATSPGCQPEWLNDLRAACQRFGERPAGSLETSSLFTLLLASGPRAIVGVFPQGVDDQGRPGALAFHALFLDPHDYAQAGGNPFQFSHLFREGWTAETKSLPSGTWLAGPADSDSKVQSASAPGRQIAALLAQGKRIAIQAPSPIDDLAGEAWQLLPEATRARLSLATWAYGNDNRFDLVALPKLSSVALDASYVDPFAPEAEPQIEPGANHLGSFRARHPWLPWVGAVGVLLGVGFGLARRPHDAGSVDSKQAERASSQRQGLSATSPSKPGLADTSRNTASASDRKKVAESLREISERFGVLQAEATHGDEDLVALMTTLARDLRYQGPLLSDDEQANLRAEDGPGSEHDRVLALKWDARIRRFAPDRPLPEDFASGSLVWQLETLIWSFHADDDPHPRLASPVELTHALADALVLDFPVRPIPLFKDQPVLRRYFAFLDRLPRR